MRGGAIVDATAAGRIVAWRAIDGDARATMRP
jgi:hypothetical protein